MGARRARQHSGSCLSSEFMRQLSDCRNVRVVHSLAELQLAMRLQRANYTVVTQSGFCATRAADLLGSGDISSADQRFIEKVLSSERIPANYNEILDVTPSLSGAAMVDICARLL